jgi:rhomboid protease GluP
MLKKQNNTVLRRIMTVEKVNLSIVLINIIIFAVLEIGTYQDKAVEWGSLFWYAIDHNKEYYRLFTSMFLHGNIEHLLYNMLTLGVIGNTLEKTIGKVKYLFIYILSGIVAALVSMRYNMERELFVQSIGASGAIFGIIGALLLVVLLNKGRVDKLGKRQMLLFAALSLYGGFTSQGVDNVAHIGGLIAGVILALIIYRKPKGRGVVS